jgi:hypothetical protein
MKDVIKHVRYSYGDRFVNKNLHDFTIVGVFIESANEYRFGISFTNPKDNFCKRIGIEIARKRAEVKPFMVVSGDVVDNFGGSIRFTNSFVNTIKYHTRYFMKLRKTLVVVE